MVVEWEGGRATALLLLTHSAPSLQLQMMIHGSSPHSDRAGLIRILGLSCYQFVHAHQTQI